MTLARNTILVGDALTQLRTLPTDCIDCVVTSPPYYALRDYGVAGQLGLEPTVEDWVAKLRAVFAEVARVLKPSGSVWLNLGDSFSRHAHYGAPPKSLLLAPERLMLALVADGWCLRNKVVWVKPNPRPTSVRDRLATAHEVVAFMTRQPHYFFDLDAIRVEHRSTGRKAAGPIPACAPAWAGPLAGKNDGLLQARPDGVPGHPLGANPRDVWRIATRGYHGAHFATFPEELVRRPLLATCPEAVCTACGRGWRREVSVRRFTVTASGNGARSRREQRSERTLGELAGCGCGAPTVPGIVLDPFLGSGTTAVVARALRRDFLGVELHPQFVALAEERLRLASQRSQPTAGRPAPSRGADQLLEAA